MAEQCRILVTIKGYHDGKGVPVEHRFPKMFNNKAEAEAFGKGFFEPPQTVLDWRVVNIETQKR